MQEFICLEVTFYHEMCITLFQDHVCNIELRPLCESWMDHLDESQRHFLEIVNTCVVQVREKNAMHLASILVCTIFQTTDIGL